MANTYSWQFEVDMFECQMDISSNSLDSTALLSTWHLDSRYNTTYQSIPHTIKYIPIRKDPKVCLFVWNVMKGSLLSISKEGVRSPDHVIRRKRQDIHLSIPCTICKTWIVPLLTKSYVNHIVHIECVDFFEGSDEHVGGDINSSIYVIKIVKKDKTL